MDKAHEVEVLSLKGPVMLLRVDGKDVEVDLALHSPRLANASQMQREHFEVSGTGYGIHWPDIDEDLSVDGLVGVAHQPPLIRAGQ
jgi:hypothetical protein